MDASQKECKQKVKEANRPLSWANLEEILHKKQKVRMKR